MMATIKDGNGSRLRPMRGWHVLHRTVFGLEHAGHHYDVDVAFFDDDVRLYTDGLESARTDLPARFPVPGGRIEIAATIYGLKRVHLVLENGTTTQLRPAKGTAERWRADLARRRPVLSQWLARAAVVVLLVGVALVLPEIAERVTQIDAVAERLGTFTSPIELPGTLATGLTAAGVLAAIERALTLRSHWLVDLETFWLD